MPKKRQNNIKVIKDPIDPETPEILAASIIRIADAMEQLSQEGLTEDGVAILVANMSGSKVTKTDVLLVMGGLKRLKSYYVREPKKS